MTGYNIINLTDMIEELGEDRTKAILSDFSCPLNPDVEFFLKYKAITFAQQRISPTHLIFGSHKGKLRLLAYFTVTLKSFYIEKHKISNTMRKKVSKFGKYIEELKRYEIPAPLIAQLGKNFKDNLNVLITGSEILKLACQKISLVQENIGGKIVYIECEDKAPLMEFYKRNGFYDFAKRQLDKDEVGLDGQYLIQMLKIL